MNRIDVAFDRLKEENRKAMIPFITAGDPDLGATIELVLAMEQGGADIIELGVPYSDPLADGAVIQASSARALKAGARIASIMNTVKTIRELSTVPLIFLVYYNSVFKYGVESFISEAGSAGIDGLIIPDLPIEERKDIIEIGDKYGVYLIPLVAPTSKDRIQKITENGKGFVYCVSTAGVTGVRQSIKTDINEYMSIVSSYTKLPKALGFGISGPEMAQRYKDCCEGIIVGSAIVRTVAEAKTREAMMEGVRGFVSQIKGVL